jgi:hypothetical protein
LFGGFSPAFAEAASRRQAVKQKIASLRSRRLCGEFFQDESERGIDANRFAGSVRYH